MVGGGGGGSGDIRHSWRPSLVFFCGRGSRRQSTPRLYTDLSLVPLDVRDSAFDAWQPRFFSRRILSRAKTKRSGGGRRRENVDETHQEGSRITEKANKEEKLPVNRTTERLLNKRKTVKTCFSLSHSLSKSERGFLSSTRGPPKSCRRQRAFPCTGRSPPRWGPCPWCRT